MLSNRAPWSMQIAKHTLRSFTSVFKSLVHSPMQCKNIFRLPLRLSVFSSLSLTMNSRWVYKKSNGGQDMVMYVYVFQFSRSNSTNIQIIISRLRLIVFETCYWAMMFLSVVVLKSRYIGTGNGLHKPLRSSLTHGPACAWAPNRWGRHKCPELEELPSIIAY